MIVPEEYRLARIGLAVSPIENSVSFNIRPEVCGEVILWGGNLFEGNIPKECPGKLPAYKTSRRNSSRGEMSGYLYRITSLYV